MKLDKRELIRTVVLLVLLAIVVMLWRSLKHSSYLT
jgi:hypothetical protein